MGQWIHQGRLRSYLSVLVRLREPELTSCMVIYMLPWLGVILSRTAIMIQGEMNLIDCQHTSIFTHSNSNSTTTMIHCRVPDSVLQPREKTVIVNFTESMLVKISSKWKMSSSSITTTSIHSKKSQHHVRVR